MSPGPHRPLCFPCGRGGHRVTGLGGGGGLLGGHSCLRVCPGLLTGASLLAQPPPAPRGCGVSFLQSAELGAFPACLPRRSRQPLSRPCPSGAGLLDPSLAFSRKQGACDWPPLIRSPAVPEGRAVSRSGSRSGERADGRSQAHGPLRHFHFCGLRKWHWPSVALSQNQVHGASRYVSSCLAGSLGRVTLRTRARVHVASGNLDTAWT